MKTFNDLQALENIAVDIKYLASNFTDVIPECCGTDLDPATALMNRHPVLNWILNSQLTSRVQSEMNDRGAQCVIVPDNANGYKIKVPGRFWSLEPDTDEEACCFPPMDFAKCAGEVPLTRICVKDCDTIDHELMGRFFRLDRNYGEIASAGQDYNEVRRRVAMLSMAFYTARNMMLGTVGTTAPGLKSFHGLLAVMSNPAVVAVAGANILSAFDTIACRVYATGGDFASYIIAVNPIIKQSILSVVRPGRNGEFPDGWTRTGDEVRFHGALVVEDRFVPFNMTNSTGEAWFLASDAVGGWMATNLLPSDDFIKRGAYTEETPANGCGSECVYYYNYGAVFNNNASRLAKVVGIPASAYCAAGTGDLGALINPTTLIPKY